MASHDPLDDSIADLETRLANYRRTRAMSARSLHRWCDILIRDTEEELRSLRKSSSDGDCPGGGCPEHDGDDPDAPR